jgi:uncharacterized cupin superfamily protein
MDAEHLPNIHAPTFDEVRDHPGYRARRARIGYQLGTERLGISVWELPAGQAAYPYHFHLAEEELLVILGGTLRLRGPSGWRDLVEGDVVGFPAGEEGAHQLVNRGTETARFLALSTNGAPDVVMYPDWGQVFAGERRPRGGGVRLFFREADAVDYYDGARPPPEEPA